MGESLRWVVELLRQVCFCQFIILWLIKHLGCASIFICSFVWFGCFVFVCGRICEKYILTLYVGEASIFLRERDYYIVAGNRSLMMYVICG